jgi:hypothetical protein
MLHLHESFDYHKGGTRIVFNMQGYTSTEENKRFRPEFTVEI